MKVTKHLTNKGYKLCVEIDASEIAFRGKIQDIAKVADRYGEFSVANQLENEISDKKFANIISGASFRSN